MSLIFTAGFDDRLSSKWTQFEGTYVTTGRNGDGMLTSTGNTYHAWANADQHATIVVGFALNIAGQEGEVLLHLGSEGITTLITNAVRPTVTHITISRTSTGQLVARRGTESGTVLWTTSANTIVPGVWAYIELKVTLSDTVGVCDLQVNGSSLATFSGDTKNAGTSTVLESLVLTPNLPVQQTFDDLYVCNGAGSVNNNFLGDVVIETLYPNGNGNSSQLLGSDGNSTDNYLLVDEPGTPSTSDFVGSPTVGQKDTYAFTNLVKVGSVFGVVAHAFAHKTDAGSVNGRILARPTSTDFAGPNFSPAVGTAASANGTKTTWELNPQTTAAWTTAEVNASEFGIEVR